MQNPSLQAEIISLVIFIVTVKYNSSEMLYHFFRLFKYNSV